MMWHWLKRLWLVAVVCLTALALPAAADELEDDHLLPLDFETPHTNWAKPYAGGKLRVLVFCNGRGTTPREIIELMERFDVDAEAVFWARIVDSSRSHWHGGAKGVERMLRLLEQRWDCYVLIGVPISHLPVEAQYKMLKPVTEGAGLVLVGGRDKRVFKRQLKPLPDFIARAKPKGAYAIKKGRGVIMPPLPNIPYELGWDTAYDYWQERLGRAVIWAAGSEPKVKLQSVSVTPNEIAWSAQPKANVQVQWAGAKGALEFQLNVRSDDGVVVKLPAEKTTAAQGSFERTLPRLRAGRYHVDVQATSADGVEAWAVEPFVVTSERRVDEVILDREWGEVGESLSGNVALVGPALGGERVVVRLRDRRERILDQAECAAGAPSFRFDIKPWLPMLVRVEAVLLSNRAEVSMAYQYFNVTKRHRDQFNFLIWDVPRGSLAPVAEASLARLGTTLQLCGGAPPRVVAAYDIAWVPYTTRILAKVDKNLVMKPQCWNDEPKANAHVAKLAEKAEDSRGHGVFVYSLGDENDVRGSCMHPACMAAYRKYLKQQYGAIAKLNASWGSSYNSFGEVKVLDPEDNDAKVALQQKNYPRWYDRQAFKCYNYVMYCKRFANAYRQFDPKSLTGFEGAGRFGRGDDIDLFVRELGFWSPYPGTADEVLKWIAPKGFPHANWMGYSKDADSLIWKYWRMVARGCTSVWWWRWDGIGRFHGFLAPHLGPWPTTKELFDETQIVRNGLGDLLIHSEPLDSGITMVYSMPSCYATQVEEGASFGSNEDCHKAWHKLIRGLGLQFRYVTDRMIRRGEFDAAKCKVLLLSRMEAMSTREASVIESFVQGGGTVIADVRPGIYDGHCKPQAAGALDKVFGIRRTGAPAGAKGKATARGLSASAKLEADDQVADPGIAVTTGKALGSIGQTPIMVVNNFGKGRAILLNLSPRTLPRLAAEDTPESVAEFFADMFAQAGVTPAVRTQTLDGRRARGVETIYWRNRANNIVALWRKGGEEEDVAVLLPKARHVYDLRHHTYRGPVVKFQTRIHPNRPTFLVLTDVRLEPPIASLSAAAAKRGGQVQLSLRIPNAQGQHALRIRVAMPNGQRADWLDRIVLVGGEAETVTLPLAYNDPTGAWTIEAIDLFTEQAAKAQLTVQ